MASFLGSILGFEFGAKIYLFWRLWQVIPDWLVLDATGCEQSELLLLCCGSTSMIPAASLWNKSLATGCSMMVYPWVDTCCLLGFKTMQRNCRGTSKCLQSCWGLEKLVLVSWKCHAVAWHHGLYEIWRQACQWFGFAFRLCSWSCMLARENPCRRICMQLAPRTSWSSVLYLSFLFAMLCSSSFCCIFICTNPKQTLLMSARSSFHCGMSTFLVTPSMCCVFICTNFRHTLKTSLCCAFYWRKPCHDHTFDLLYFHMYKPQTNLVNVCAQLISLWNEHFFGDTFDVLCFHMYKLQAYFENISVLRILLEKAMPWPHLRSAVFSYVQTPIKPQF